jgi:hypothetical protein
VLTDRLRYQVAALNLPIFRIDGSGDDLALLFDLQAVRMIASAVTSRTMPNPDSSCVSHAEFNKIAVA